MLNAECFMLHVSCVMFQLTVSYGLLTWSKRIISGKAVSGVSMLWHLCYLCVIVLLHPIVIILSKLIFRLSKHFSMIRFNFFHLSKLSYTRHLESFWLALFENWHGKKERNGI